MTLLSVLPRPTRRMLCLALAAGAAVLAVFAGGLVGPAAEGSPAGPLSALLVVALAAAVTLALLGETRPRLRRGSLILASLAAALCLGPLALPWAAGQGGAFSTARQHLSSPTAGALLVASFAVLLRWGKAQPAWAQRQAAAALALGALGAGLLGVASFLGGLHLLYGGHGLPMSLPAGLGALLLGLAVLVACGPDTWPLALFQRWRPEQETGVARWLAQGPLGLLLLLGLGGFGIGSIYLRSQIQEARQNAQRELAEVADLKALEISRWYGERQREGQRILHGSLIQAQLSRFLAGGPQAPPAAQVLEWMQGLQTGTNRGVFLLDGQGRIRLSVPSAPQDTSFRPGPLDAARIQEALHSREVLLQDLHGDREGGPLHFSLWVPVGLSSVAGAPSRGLVLMYLDPCQSLFPLVQAWPTPSPSAEVQILRRDGDQVLLLNDRRHRPGTALTLRLPLESPAKHLGAQAVLGRQGAYEGPDDRGVPVLAAFRPVSGTPWSLVAKVDLEEVYGPVRRKVWLVEGALLGLLLLAALVLGLILRQRDAEQLEARLRLEREKRILTDRYAHLMEQANDAILVIGLDGRILEANAQALVQYGHSLETLKSMTVMDLRPPESRAEAPGQLQSIQAGTPLRFETRHLRSDGTEFPVEVSTRRVQTGETPVILSIIRDITERKAQEAELRRQRGLYGALSQVNQAIVWSADRQALLDRICEVMVRFGGFRMAWIGWDDPVTHQVSVAAREGDLTGMLDRVAVRSDESPLGRGAVGTAIRQGAPCVFNDFLGIVESLPWREELADSGFAAIAAFPIRLAGEVCGALAVYAGEKGFFGPQEALLLEEAALDISFALDHLAGEELRRESERALRASEEKFAKAFQSSPDCVTITRLTDGAFLAVNEGFTQTMGYTEAEVLGKSSLGGGLGTWARSEDRARFLDTFQREGKVVGFEATFRRKDGSLLTGLLSANAIELEGQPAVLAITRDITLMRSQTKILERLTQLYAALSQVNQAIVWSSDRQAMLDKICEVMVQFGQFRMAWIGWDDPATHQVQVAARHGDALGYLEGIQIRSDASPAAQGPMGTAIREGHTCIMNDFLGEPAARPWREAAQRCGYAAAAAFPIRQEGMVCGALMVYASDQDFFGPQEIALLEEAAGDVSFALDHLAGEARRLEAEAALHKVSVAVEQSPLCVIITDPAGTIEYVNPRFTEVTGYTLEEAIGQNPRILKSPRTPPELYQDLWATLTRGEVWVGELENLKKGGEPFQERATIVPVKDVGDRVAHYVAIKEDITAVRKAEAERRVLEAQLHQSQKLESLGSLAGGVAHDMNNVLGAILSLASSLLEKEDLSRSQSRSLETIQTACLRGRGVVKSLLYFARKDLHEEVSLDLNALVQEMTQLLSHTTLQRISLEMDLEGSLGRLRGDPGALSHALMNLCVNALDAMPGSGVLRIQTASAPDGGLLVRVADTGQGMSPEVLQRAMEPFFTTKPQGKGTGLGLSMVYGTMQAHEGRFELRSQPGKGTEALLYFPASRRVPLETLAEVVAPEPSESARGLHILLVDDDELIRESVASVLEMLGHRARVAPGGPEALDLLAAGEPVDLLILDMNMPGMNGAEALARILPLRPGLPVLMATGYSSEDIAPILASHPNVSCIQKPFSLKELKRRIDELGIRPVEPPGP